MNIAQILLIFLMLFYSVYNLLYFDTNYASLRIFSALPVLLLLMVSSKNLKSKFSLLNPINFISLSIFFGTTIRTLWLTSSSFGNNIKKKEILYNQNADDLFSPIMYINLFAILFIIGYRFNILKFRNLKIIGNYQYKFNQIRLDLVLIISLTIGFLALSLLLSQVGLSQIGADDISEKRRVFDETGQRNAFSYLRVIISIVKYSFLLSLAYLASNLKNSKRVITYVLSVLSILFVIIYAIIVSSRTEILFILLSSFIIITILRGLPIKTIFISSFIFLFIANSIIQLRGNYKYESSFIEEIVGNNNLFGVAKTGVIISHTDANQFKLGTTYASWLFAPVPRIIWKDKPTINPGLIVRKEIMPTGSINNIGGGVPPGFVAEAYWNFGIIGIMILSFIWGSFCSSFHKKFIKIFKSANPKNINPYYLVIYSAFLIELTIKLAGGSFTQFLINSFEIILLVWVISKFNIITIKK
tara:strand:+ start:1301 stop:2716 length:1416 start_codon:yes stop_codon:yes gene_type:complete